MNDSFFKFPSTPHLKETEGLIIREDKILPKKERDLLLQQFLIVEEKVDGANLGFAFDKQGDLCIQNRGSYLYPPYSGQWKKLSEWLVRRIDQLFEILSDRYILFGEWCYAKHSEEYHQLPDWLLGFDIFDKNEQCFLSVDKRNLLFERMEIVKVPEIARGKFTLAELENFLQDSSAFGSDAIEGIYLRYDQNGCLKRRAKLVRADFIQKQLKHWSKQPIVPNQLQVPVGMS